ncbi:hypothetical protein EMIT0162MI3_10329 [Pseudomonas chlororaphis]
MAATINPTQIKSQHINITPILWDLLIYMRTGRCCLVFMEAGRRRPPGPTREQEPATSEIGL